MSVNTKELTTTVSIFKQIFSACDTCQNRVQSKRGSSQFSNEKGKKNNIFRSTEIRSIVGVSSNSSPKIHLVNLSISFFFSVVEENTFENVALMKKYDPFRQRLYPQHMQSNLCQSAMHTRFTLFLSLLLKIPRGRKRRIDRNSGWIYTTSKSKIKRANAREMNGCEHLWMILLVTEHSMLLVHAKEDSRSMKQKPSEKLK